MGIEIHDLQSCYKHDSFAMQLRAASSFKKAGLNLNTEVGEAALRDFCAEAEMDEEIVRHLVIALGWGGKLEFENWFAARKKAAATS